MANGRKNEDRKSAAGSIGAGIAKGAASALVAISLLAGAAFSGPADIADDQSASQLAPPPIVMDAGDFVNTPVDDDDDAEEEKSTRPGLIARFRQAVYSLPQSIRLVLITPLWLLGTGIMTAISFLWNVIFASPLGAFIASFAAGFAILAGLLALTVKVLFPDIPLRKIFSRRSVLILGTAALVLSLIDAAAPLYWHQYPLAAGLIKLTLGGGVTAFLIYRGRAVLRAPAH